MYNCVTNWVELRSRVQRTHRDGCLRCRAHVPHSRTTRRRPVHTRPEAAGTLTHAARRLLTLFNAVRPCCRCCRLKLQHRFASNSDTSRARIRWVSQRDQATTWASSTRPLSLRQTACAHAVRTSFLSASIRCTSAVGAALCLRRRAGSQRDPGPRHGFAIPRSLCSMRSLR